LLKNDSYTTILACVGYAANIKRCGVDICKFHITESGDNTTAGKKTSG
jgi:hypothetical protein